MDKCISSKKNVQAVIYTDDEGLYLCSIGNITVINENLYSRNIVKVFLIPNTILILRSERIDVIFRSIDIEEFSIFIDRSWAHRNFLISEIEVVKLQY